MSEAADSRASGFDFSALISNLISNPETLSKIGDIVSKIGVGESSSTPPLSNSNTVNSSSISTTISNISEYNENTPPTFQKEDNENFATKLPEILNKITESNQENSTENKQQIALLLAIRPYLSDHRKELIDTFIKMNRLGSIFKNLT